MNLVVFMKYVASADILASCSLFLCQKGRERRGGTSCRSVLINRKSEKSLNRTSVATSRVSRRHLVGDERGSSIINNIMRYTVLLIARRQRIFQIRFVRHTYTRVETFRPPRDPLPSHHSYLMARERIARGNRTRKRRRREL